MARINFLWQFAIWYYAVAPATLLKIWADFIWFLYHFFSIPLLMRTLFSKWRRIGEVRTKRFDIGDFLSVLFINTVMRIVGFFIRAFTILAGLSSIIVAIVFGIAVFVLWFFLPVAIVMLGMVGTKLLLAID
jgi:hypothetical protein